MNRKSPRFCCFACARAPFAALALLAALPQAPGNVYESPLTGRNKVDWFIANFKDHGDGTVQRDYLGGFQSYIGHGGMDIWAYDYKAMDDGIEVRAAAPGTVMTVRDQIYEMWPGVNYLFPAPYILIWHADGSQALYYHIRHGSAAVTNGQVVTTGQKLAIMGPHLHFEVQSAASASLEIMTNEMGHVQNFDWFDSYSNQVIRQVLGMGVTKTNDPLLRQDFSEQTPLSYTCIHSGPFSPWIKFVGLPKLETLTIRLVVESGPGWDLDLTDWPMYYIENLKWSYCYWYVWSLVDGTTYRLQYRWNGGEWTDGPGDSSIIVDDAAEEVYTSRFSPHYTRYVAANSRTPQAPYTSWETAATTIQAAIDASQAGDLVIVSNGVYDTGSTVVQGAPTRVAVTRNIAVRSANGPHVTVINGQDPAGGGAMRCAYVTNSAFLAGFTLTNGAAGEQDGGGVFCEQWGGVVNCIISGCSAANGGGAYQGLVQNCLVAGNRASGSGGGTYQSEVCFSTIADNRADGDGGGSWGGYLFSCIVWGNTANGQTNNFVFGPGSWVWYSCITPSAAGYMNITNNPEFVNSATGDYRLSSSSPCIDCGGGNASWALDLDHAARIVNNLTDMGAFEYSPLPVAPWWVAAGAGDRRRVRIEWSAAPRASGYRIWRHTQDYWRAAALIGGTEETGFNDTDAALGVGYFYWVQATNAAGVSAFSSTAAGRRRAVTTGLLQCDFDGDGASEPAIYSAATGGWYAVTLSNTLTLCRPLAGWAGATPVADDYDGDCISDVAVYDEAGGLWEVALSRDGGAPASASFGGPGWAPIPLDYDGDGKSDPAIYNRANGTWQVLCSMAGYTIAVLAGFGGDGCEAAPGDYDGDGKADPGIYAPALPLWSVMLSSLGYATVSVPFGGKDYVAVAADYDGDGKWDPAVYLPAEAALQALQAGGEATGIWIAMLSGSGYQVCGAKFGGSGCVPVPGDYDGDGKTDPGLYQASTGQWLFLLSGLGYAPSGLDFGGPAYLAIASRQPAIKP